MNRLKATLFASTLIASSAVPASADVNVVASIKPVHSLVAAVMEGVGTPELIVEGAGSPHTYALKPSQAQSLQDADVVFWIGHELEAFLKGPVETLSASAKSVELINAHDLIKLEFREGGAFDEHDRDDHDDHDHSAEAGHDDHGHRETAEAGHDHDHGHEETADAGHDGHDHGEFDAHIWLDPVNAKAMVNEIEEVLAQADPSNAVQYEANAEVVLAKLDALTAEITVDLAPVHDKGFIVFHDAYQYFEKRFDVTAAGSVTVSPEIIPGAARVAEIREKVQELGATCVFAEPQFEPKLVATVVEGTAAKSGVIDPLGATITEGPELYFDLIRNMATSVKTCLSESS
ncbi:MAG: zinc ABC transporter substrate-binding protein ZnuA [Pseudomonadota bacterium]